MHDNMDNITFLMKTINMYQCYSILFNLSLIKMYSYLILKN